MICPDRRDNLIQNLTGLSLVSGGIVFRRISRLAVHGSPASQRIGDLPIVTRSVVHDSELKLNCSGNDDNKDRVIRFDFRQPIRHGEMSTSFMWT